MKKITSANTIILCLFVISSAFVSASEFADSDNCLLFKINRNRDANEIFYEVKTEPDGSLDLVEPVKIYWIKYTKKGKTEPLTKIQQHFAYGLNFLEIASDSAAFQFVSFSEKTLKLRKNELGNFAVFTKMEGIEVELERVFIHIDGGTFLLPKITRVEIHAKNPQANQLVVEIIKP